MITDDMTFIGPLQTTHGAEAYIAINEQLLQFHAGVNMLHQFEDGDHVCSIYELIVTAPSGEKVSMPMSDWIRVDNGRIAEQRIYYDPREFEQKFGM
jgi:ketosteroid isomerase-like protein